MVRYLLKHVSLSDELKHIIVESTVIRSFKKGAVLLKEGDMAGESYFVLKGCIASYVIRDGEEKTMEFYTEEQPVAPAAYNKQAASGHYLKCIEDTVASVSTPAHEKEMFGKYPQFESICRIMAEAMAAGYQESLVDYRLNSPEDRYLALLKNRPGLCQRVPQYQLASYLGIKPESLSRIRRRLATK